MSDGYTDEGYLVSRKYAYSVFTLLFVIYMVDYIDRYVVSGLVPYLKATVEKGGLGFSDTQCALLMAAVYWSIVVLTFPLSILLDRWRRMRSIGIMVTLWSLATGACAFAKSFPQLFTARVGVGVGEAGYVPGGYALIAAYFPEKKRDLMNGFWNASIPLGVVIGTVLGGFIAVHFGWRHAFGLMAIPGLILAFLFFLTKDYKTVELTKTVARAAKPPEKIKMKVPDIVREFLNTPVPPLYLLRIRGKCLRDQRPPLLAAQLFQSHGEPPDGQGNAEVVGYLPACHPRRPDRRPAHEPPSETDKKRPLELSGRKLPHLVRPAF